MVMSKLDKATSGFYLHKITIIGVGLIGGSFALALKRAGVVATVSGWDANPENLSLANQLQIVDQHSASLADAVHGAELVMLAVPVGAMEAAAVNGSRGNSHGFWKCQTVCSRGD
jgi:prephenate dehydrogenase